MKNYISNTDWENIPSTQKFKNSNYKLTFYFLNLQYILNVTPDLPNVFQETGKIEYLQIPITDHWSQDLSVHFPAAIKFIG